MIPPPILPDDGNTFQFFLADQVSYDSNLYRLPENTQVVGTVAVPNASKSDVFNTASAGFNGQGVLGRQVLDLDLRADNNRFDRNTELNNTGYSGDLLWNWRASGYFSGTLGAIYTHSLAGFDETRFLGRDLVDAQTYEGSARYQIGPRWALYGSGTDLRISHSAEAAQLQNYENESGTGGIEYATDLNDSFGLQYKFANGKYPSGTLNSENGTFFSPDFHDQTLQVVMKYAVSDKTQLTGYGGYLERRYPNTSIGSFSGGEGRLTMNWAATEKTQFVVAVWRELHAYLVSEADYFVSTGGSVAPVWLPTNKIRVALILSYENQDYIPQSNQVLTATPGAVPAGGQLNAKLKIATAELDWTPRDNWIIKLTLNYQDRNSNQPAYTFSDNLFTFGALYKIH